MSYGGEMSPGIQLIFFVMIADHSLSLVTRCAVGMGPLQLFVAATQEVRRDLVQLMGLPSRPNLGMFSQKDSKKG